MGAILIVYDEGGIADVRKDRSLFTVPKALKTAADLARKGGEAVNPIPIVVDTSDIGVALISIENSERLSPEQRRHFRSILLSYDPVLDSVKSVHQRGVFHSANPPSDGGGPPTYPTGFKFVDP